MENEIKKNSTLFFEEAFELLIDAESSLLILEREPSNQEHIAQLFRAIHTIKGSGAMFGFEDTASFAHEFESFLDQARNGDIEITKTFIDVSLSACDYIKRMLTANTKKKIKVNSEKKGEILKAFQSCTDKEELRSKNEKSHPNHIPANTYWIQYTPEPDLFHFGINPLIFLNELRELGKCLILCRMNNLPNLEEMDPTGCYIEWKILLRTDRPLSQIKDVFLFLEDKGNVQIQSLSENELPPELQELHSSKSEIIETQNHTCDLEKHKSDSLTENQSRKNTFSSIRVQSEKLDNLIDLFGELIVAEENLTAIATQYPNSELTTVSEKIGSLTMILQEIIMNIRMVPIGTLFKRFKRFVRDLSQEEQKEIHLTLTGMDTELDKSVIERLNDPLIHLLRNCIDHGIELPADRQLTDKPSHGTIQLSAEQSGAHVLIKIKDDGRGISKATIQKKAIEKNLIHPDAELSEQEAMQLLFESGFSTSNKITQVSGRGVGMDVVKRNVDGLGGSISIHSKKGMGTTITLKIPLTLGIIEGLLVKVSDYHLIFPLSRVIECVQITEKHLDNTGHHIIDIRGEILPFIHLGEILNIQGSSIENPLMVITSIGDQKIGFAVDESIGEHQVVIKPLSRFFHKVKGISGASILGDGTIVLILDLPELFLSLQNADRSEINKTDRLFHKTEVPNM